MSEGGVRSFFTLAGKKSVRKQRVEATTEEKRKESEPWASSCFVVFYEGGGSVRMVLNLTPPH